AQVAGPLRGIPFAFPCSTGPVSVRAWGSCLERSSADDRGTTHRVDFGKNLAIALVMFGLGATCILIWQVQSPIFHTILDTSAFLASGLVALLLWDISKRTNQPLAWFLAIAFGVLTMAELLHTLIALE